MHAYIGDKNARFYACYTSKEHARNEWRPNIMKKDQGEDNRIETIEWD